MQLKRRLCKPIKISYYNCDTFKTHLNGKLMVTFEDNWLTEHCTKTGIVDAKTGKHYNVASVHYDGKKSVLIIEKNSINPLGLYYKFEYEVNK